MTAVPVKPRHRYAAVTAGGRDPAKAISSLAQVVEVLTGGRGEGLDRALTPRDLLKMGLIELAPGGGELVPPKTGDDTADVDAPTTPENVQAVGGFTAILLSWNVPRYKGHFEAEVWRSSIDVLGSAAMVGTTKGNLYSDLVATGSKFYYWVRFVNRKGERGPFHSTNGVLGETKDDIGWLIDKITQEGNESPLVRWLREDVTLINEETYLTMMDQIIADLNAPAGALANVWSELNSLNSVKNQLLSRADLLEQTQTAFNNQLGNLANLITTTRNEVTAFYNAVLTVDPETGTVTLEALEGYRTANDARVTAAEQSISALSGQISQSVTRAEFGQLVGPPFDVTKTYAVGDEVIYNFQLYRCYKAVTTAGAWTGPVNWTFVGSIVGKFTDVQQQLNAVSGQIQQKVSQAAFDANTLRLSTVEQWMATYVDNNVSVGRIVLNLQSELWRSTEQVTKAELDRWNSTVEEGRYRVGQATFNQSITTKVDAEASRLEEARYQLVQHGNAIASNLDKIVLVTNKEAATAMRLSELRVEYDTTAVQARELFNMTAGSNSAFLASYRQLSAEIKDPLTGLAKTRAILDQVTTMTLSASSALMQAINRAQIDADNAESMAADILTLSGVANGSALAQRFATLSSKLDTTAAAITQLDKSLTGPNGAIATSIRDYTVDYNGFNVSLQQLALASASTGNKFETMWGVKSTIGGLTAGFGLYNNGSMTQFAVNAQQFLILGQSGAVNPFMVVDGKVLIDTALIKAATIQELVAGTVVADTVKVNASLTAPVIVGGSITAADLVLTSGGYQTFLQPYQNFMLWAGPVGVSRNAQNAAFAVANNGQVYAKGITIYDIYGNVMLDSMGNLNGTYIKDLSVDAFKIKGQSVNLKKIAQANAVNIPPNGSAVSKATAEVVIDSVVPGTLLDITFEVRFYCEYHDKRMLEFQAGIYDEILGFYLQTFRIKPPFWSQDGKSHILNTVQLTGRTVLEYTYATTNVTRRFSVHVWAVGSYWAADNLGLVTTEHEGWLVVDIGKR
jgi:hypothetical protein